MPASVTFVCCTRDDHQLGQHPEMSQPGVGDRVRSSVSSSRLVKPSQVREPGIAHVGSLQPQHLQAHKSGQVGQARVADPRVLKAELLEPLQISEVCQSRAGDLRSIERQVRQGGQLADGREAVVVNGGAVETQHL